MSFPLSEARPRPSGRRTTVGGAGVGVVVVVVAAVVLVVVDELASGAVVDGVDVAVADSVVDEVDSVIEVVVSPIASESPSERPNEAITTATKTSPVRATMTRTIRFWRGFMLVVIVAARAVRVQRAPG
jgi:hypothetical protein